MARGKLGPVGMSIEVTSVDVQLERLDGLDLGQLRTDYRNRSGRIAPARISRSLLVRVLAYRVQAEQFRDLSPHTRRLLDRLGAANEGECTAVVEAPAVEAAGRLKPGTMLRREWQGRVEQVIVTDTGFLWTEKAFASLSAVAGAITGTKWNGYRFFGLPSPTTSGPKISRKGQKAVDRVGRPDLVRLATPDQTSPVPASGS